MASLLNAAANEDIIALSRRAFDEVSEDTEASQIALKALANNLLLHEATRPKFAASNYPTRVADRLQVLSTSSPLSWKVKSDNNLGKRRGPPRGNDMLANSIFTHLWHSLQL